MQLIVWRADLITVPHRRDASAWRQSTRLVFSEVGRSELEMLRGMRQELSLGDGMNAAKAIAEDLQCPSIVRARREPKIRFEGCA
jgi:hypothetical protein